LAADTQLARERVASQIKTLTQFLYLYGGVAKGIESAERAAREGEASAVAIEQNERTKTRVRESIRNVRDGLDKLEVDFRINAALRSHYASVAGISAIGQQAESHAAASRFDEAGRSLLSAVNKLADALTTIR
jgi:hypothetical protein